MDCFDNLFASINVNKKDEVKVPKKKKVGCECKIPDIINDTTTARKICRGCGTVLGKLHNTDPEWRYYGNADNNRKDDPSRCGLPIDNLLPKSSMNTKMKYAGSMWSSIVRLDKWHQIHPQERSLYGVSKYIDKVLLNVTDVSEQTKQQAKLFYKQLTEDTGKIKGSLTRGNTRKAFIAACILESCDTDNTPMHKAEIARLCNIKLSDITTGEKKFSELSRNKGLMLRPDNKKRVHNFIRKFCVRLNFTKTMQDITHILYHRTTQLKILTSSNEMSIISGLLYYVSRRFYNTTEMKLPIIKLVTISGVTLEKVNKILNKNKPYIEIGLGSFFP